MTKDKETYKEYNENKEKNDDDILDEALKEAKIMRGNVKEFGKAVENSNKLVDATNRNMDRSINNVNRVNKEMKKAY
jgi:ABC-type transporter Mla subunit MlaD